MTDVEKLQAIAQLVNGMSQQFKDEVIKQLSPSEGEAQVTVSSNEQIVRVDFGRPLAWFAIPKEHAIQLGVSLMQHGGARLEQVVKDDGKKPTDA